jgi:hypothetical protein
MTWYILDSYVVAAYYNSYMKKIDCTLTTTFWKIRDECAGNKDDKIQTI